ncbi:unnamed protein product [Didymodactylos carnosus]|uniref:N-alpha-acetyltransferase 60 n=1 Tax=Didymodactylos carnosus TaxID=1234261 RepID=A0A814UHE3_9BILA|nr:unnamed protein product [Didymodactylos carnosus]CAF3938610.1 unnamed protein product [Didymodactylos carnosus]
MGLGMYKPYVVQFNEQQNYHNRLEDYDDNKKMNPSRHITNNDNDIEQQITNMYNNTTIVNVYHNTNFAPWQLEEIFLPLFGNAYSFPVLINMSDHTWCVYIENEMIAAVLATKRLFDNSQALYLILFGVKKSYQGIGIGTKLLDIIIQYTKRDHCNFIFLHTECSNIKAIRLYEKLGFKKESFVPNYYRSISNFRPDAYRMLLTLK